MSGIDSIPPRKRCSRCKRFLPLKFPYFTHSKGNSTGFRSNCRGCKYGWSSDEFQVEILLHSLSDKGYKPCKTCGEIKAFDDYYKKLRARDGRQSECKACCAKYWKQFRRENGEKLNAYYADWSRKNRGHSKAKTQRWRLRHPERYHHLNKAQNLRYRARKKSLPDDFTSEDWQIALGYFNGCCAVCGREPSELYYIAADHWIPLKSATCPGTVTTNIVPLCHSKKGGTGSCNLTKKNRVAEKWLVDYHGEEKALEILERINAYFEWVKTQE